MEEVTDAKTVSDCIEMATMDAYGDSELGTGWLTALEEVFEGTKEIILGDERVKLKKFDVVGDTHVVAVCMKGGKPIKVTLDSIDFIKPNKVQALWVKAYLHWLGCGRG